ncbi:MAG: iron ABC transporter permease [Thermotaleaceae bacterium]
MNSNHNIIIHGIHCRRIKKIILAGILSLGAFTVSIMIGTMDFSYSQIWQGLWKASSDPLTNQIIHSIRLPRVLTGFLVGMHLSVAGALLQGILRNPLASPHIIGVNAGAGFVAVLVMIFAPGQFHLIPMGSFMGALGAALLVYLLAAKSQNSSTLHIVLAGVAVSALLNALTSGLMYINSDDLQITYSWLLGSLSGRSWQYLNILWPYSAVGLTTAFFLSPKLNLFQLGDEVGSSLGLSVKLYRMLIIVVAAILAGSGVSVAGTIGFIGLAAPHLARLLVGNDYRYSLLLSGLLGGCLLVASDTLARSLFQPVELSVGIVTAILGAPFFLFLLYKKSA